MPDSVPKAWQKAKIAQKRNKEIKVRINNLYGKMLGGVDTWSLFSPWIKHIEENIQR